MVELEKNGRVNAAHLSRSLYQTAGRNLRQHCGGGWEKHTKVRMITRRWNGTRKPSNELGRETELREAAAEACWSVTSKLYEEKKHAESIPFLDRAIELKPDYALAYARRGVAYNELKKYQRALEDYNRAIELDSKDAWAYSCRGKNYNELKAYELALDDLNQALTLDPKDANTINNRGATYSDLKEYQQAIEDYDRAIELDPKYASAYYNRGNAYSDLKEYRRAIADYDRAIELDPKYARAYFNRGNAYSDLKEYRQAIEDYDRAIDLDPKFAGAYYNRGLAFLFLKNTEQARADYARCWELDPTNVNAAWMAEWAGMGKERSGAELAKRLEDFTIVDSQQYVAHVCKGVALGLFGKLKEGLALLEQAISLKPEEWDAYFWKGMLCAYYYRGRNLVAMESLEMALEMDLPPVLLTPLYWLEKDDPGFFKKYAAPFLVRYEI